MGLQRNSVTCPNPLLQFSSLFVFTFSVAQCEPENEKLRVDSKRCPAKWKISVFLYQT